MDGKGLGGGGMGGIVKPTNYHLGRRLHSLADRIIVSTRAQMSRLTVKSEPRVFHVANVAVKTFLSTDVFSLCER